MAFKAKAENGLLDNLYPYQKELLDPISSQSSEILEERENMYIFSKTGSGKTFVLFQYIFEIFKYEDHLGCENRKLPIVFTTERNVLIDQQFEACQEKFGHLWNIIKVSSSDNCDRISKFRAAIDDSETNNKSTVIFCTTGLFREALFQTETSPLSASDSPSKVYLTDFRAILLDEAHQARGDSNAVELLKPLILIKNRDTFINLINQEEFKRELNKANLISEVSKLEVDQNFSDNFSTPLPQIIATSATLNTNDEINFSRALNSGFRSLACLDISRLISVRDPENLKLLDDKATNPTELVFDPTSRTSSHNNHNPSEENFVTAIENKFIQPLLIDKLKKILQNRTKDIPELLKLKKFSPVHPGFLQNIIEIQKKCIEVQNKKGGPVGIVADILLEILIQVGHIMQYAEYLDIENTFDLLTAIPYLSPNHPGNKSSEALDGLDPEAVRFYKQLRDEDRREIYIKEKKFPKKNRDYFTKLKNNFKSLKLELIEKYKNVHTSYFQTLLDDLAPYREEPSPSNFSPPFDPKKKALIITQRVAAVLVLEKYFSKRGFKTVTIVGRSKMADSDIKLATDKLKANQAQVIFATNTVQEGFDMPDCDFTIRFRKDESATDSQQAKGRTRKKDGKTKFIGPDANSKNYSNNQKSEQMVKVFKKLEELAGFQGTAGASSSSLSSAYTRTIHQIQRETIVEKLLSNKNEEIEKLKKRSTERLRFSQAKILCKRCRGEICPMTRLKKYDCHFVIPIEVLKDAKFVYEEREKKSQKEFPSSCTNIEMLDKKVCCKMKLVNQCEEKFDENANKVQSFKVCQDNEIGRIATIDQYHDVVLVKCDCNN